MKKILFITGIIGMVIPELVFAQAGSPTIVTIVAAVEGVITALFPIITALAILAFGYSLAKYLAAKDLADQSVYKAGLINSIIAIFVLFTVVGLVTVLARSLGIPNLGVDITTSTTAGISPGTASGISTFRNLALAVSKFVSTRIIPIMLAGAILFFFGNIVIGITKNDQEAERTQLNAYLKWGILAIFIILTFFSIVSIFTGSLFGTKAVIPQFQTSE